MMDSRDLSSKETMESAPWISADAPKKILIIRLQAFGDVLISLPYAQAMQGILEVRKKIREVLTPEQQEKMGKAENARVGQFADRMVDRLKKEVGITEEQEKSIRSIVEEMNPMKAGADNSTPMPQRFMQARERVRNLLTPEQQEKFDKMQGPGGGMLRRFMPGGGQQRPQEEN